MSQHELIGGASNTATTYNKVLVDTDGSLHTSDIVYKQSQDYINASFGQGSSLEFDCRAYRSVRICGNQDNTTPLLLEFSNESGQNYQVIDELIAHNINGNICVNHYIPTAPNFIRINNPVAVNRNVSFRIIKHN
jgi:hypothetical protein